MAAAGRVVNAGGGRAASGVATRHGGRAEQAAAHAAAAARAYEAAFAETVPPLVIAENRALLMELLATNLLGQNTAAIAATEMQYGEMWAQDAAAMYGYAGTSAAAAALPPFEPAEPTTNPDGVASQAAAVAQAAGNNSAQGLEGVPQTLSFPAGATSNPANPTLSLGGIALNPEGDGLVIGAPLGDLLEGLTGSQTLDASTPFDAFIRLISPTRLFVTTFRDIEGLASQAMPKAAASAARAAEAALPAATSGAGLGSVGSIGGAVGKAASIGGLSVSAGWASAAPTAPPVTVALNGLTAASSVEPAGTAVGGVPMMPVGGTGRGAAAHFVAPRYGFKPTVIAQPPAGG